LQWSTPERMRKAGRKKSEVGGKLEGGEEKLFGPVVGEITGGLKLPGLSRCELLAREVPPGLKGSTQGTGSKGVP